MATTTTQYVTTDYLNNEEFLKASNIKAGSNITLSTSGKNVTINADKTELRYYNESTAESNAYIQAPNKILLTGNNHIDLESNSVYCIGPCIQIGSVGSGMSYLKNNSNIEITSLISNNSIYAVGPYVFIGRDADNSTRNNL